MLLTKRSNKCVVLTQAHDALIASTSIPSSQYSDIDKSKLGDLDSLQEHGKKDGQIKMVSVGSSIEAHQWVEAEMKWTKVGDVVDNAAGSSQKKVHNGQEYDFVFDVDVADGAPPLKLPYNVSRMSI